MMLEGSSKGFVLQLGTSVWLPNTVLSCSAHFLLFSFTFRTRSTLSTRVLNAYVGDKIMHLIAAKATNKKRDCIILT